MTVLEFIFGIILIVAVVFTVIGTVAMKYDSKKIELENSKLQLDLQNARKNKQGGKK